MNGFYLHFNTVLRGEEMGLRCACELGYLAALLAYDATHVLSLSVGFVRSGPKMGQEGIRKRATRIEHATEGT